MSIMDQVGLRPRTVICCTASIYLSIKQRECPPPGLPTGLHVNTCHNTACALSIFNKWQVTSLQKKAQRQKATDVSKQMIALINYSLFFS